MPICNGITLKNTKCTRYAVMNSDKCYQHLKTNKTTFVKSQVVPKTKKRQYNNDTDDNFDDNIDDDTDDNTDDNTDDTDNDIDNNDDTDNNDDENKSENENDYDYDDNTDDIKYNLHLYPHADNVTITKDFANKILEIQNDIAKTLHAIVSQNNYIKQSHDINSHGIINPNVLQPNVLQPNASHPNVSVSGPNVPISASNALVSNALTSNALMPSSNILIPNMSSISSNVLEPNILVPNVLVSNILEQNNQTSTQIESQLNTANCVTNNVIMNAIEKKSIDKQINTLKKLTENISRLGKHIISKNSDSIRKTDCIQIFGINIIIKYDSILNTDIGKFKNDIIDDLNYLFMNHFMRDENALQMLNNKTNFKTDWDFHFQENCNIEWSYDRETTGYTLDIKINNNLRDAYIIKSFLNDYDNVKKINTSLSSELIKHQQCILCVENNKNALIMPCKHICCCFDCINDNNIDTCPICRRQINKIMKIYIC